MQSTDNKRVCCHTQPTTPTHHKHNRLLVQRPAQHPHGGVRNPKPPRTAWKHRMAPAVPESTGGHTYQKNTHKHKHNEGETREAAERKALITSGYAATHSQPQQHTRNITNYLYNGPHTAPTVGSGTQNHNVLSGSPAWHQRFRKAQAATHIKGGHTHTQCGRDTRSSSTQSTDNK